MSIQPPLGRLPGGRAAFQRALADQLADFVEEGEEAAAPADRGGDAAGA